MNNMIEHHRTLANAHPRALAGTQAKSFQLSPRETARVLCGFSTARASQGARAFYSKFAGKTQVGEPMPGASAPLLPDGAPGCGVSV